jgi:hypothetical protein
MDTVCQLPRHLTPQTDSLISTHHNLKSLREPPQGREPRKAQKTAM